LFRPPSDAAKVKGSTGCCGSRERGRHRRIARGKKLGVTRGMLTSHIRQVYPACVVASSSYATYSLFSKRMVSICRQFVEKVEVYSIDEVFMLIERDKVKAGLVVELKKYIEKALDITVSVGIAETKSLAKLGSNADKPSGYVDVTKIDRVALLQKTPIDDVWGIGHRTAKKLKVLGIQTAHQFTLQPEIWVRQHFPRPFLDIWQELNNMRVMRVDSRVKDTYKSIQVTRTHVPATDNPNLIKSRLFLHIEMAFKQARKYNYVPHQLYIFLKNQRFAIHSTNIKLPPNTMYPFTIRDICEEAFWRVYKKGHLYRATGCTIENQQLPLIGDSVNVNQKLSKLYSLYDKNMIHFASNLSAFPKKRNKSEDLIFF